MRPHHLFALFMSATSVLVMADIVSASRELVATTSGDEERVSTATNGLLTGDSPDVNQPEERLAPFESPITTMFIQLIKPFQAAFTELKQLLAKVHGTIFHSRPVSTTSSFRDFMDMVFLQLVHVASPHKALLMLVRSEFIEHTFDVRLTTAAKVVLTKDFCKFLVAPLLYLNRYGIADLPVLATLRDYLSEFELAILISRAVKERSHTAISLQNEQFRVWRNSDKSPQHVRNAFQAQLPLLSEPGFKEPSPFLPGDETIL
uniref:RxLR effector candidate protein n=1 Tax=Peronospora matthiolae TaxID=2874970 RepID=A0AAV1TZA7_9STRA